MPEPYPAERTGSRPGGVLQSGSNPLRHTESAANGFGEADGGKQPAETGGEGCRKTAGGRGHRLRGTSSQRVHHADGLPAECLRRGPDNGHTVGHGTFCRLRRRCGGHLSLVLPPDGRVWNTTSAFEEEGRR